MRWRDRSMIVGLYRDWKVRRAAKLDGSYVKRPKSSNDGCVTGFVGTLAAFTFHAIGVMCVLLLFASNEPREGYSHLWLLVGFLAFPIGNAIWRKTHGPELPRRRRDGEPPDRQGFPDYG